MKLKDVKKIAVEQGIKTGGMSKSEIIKAIQRAEGNFDCFGTPKTAECDRAGCLWRGDCLAADDARTF